MKISSGYPNIFFCFILIELIPHILSITTTHHDKPPESNLAIMASKMKQEELLHYNMTIPVAERQKRLLPYTNFYSKHSFNQPNNIETYISPQRYLLVAPKQSAFQAFQQKFNELTSSSHQPKTTDSQAAYQPKIKFTPFLESNAIPGAFVPMRTPNQENVNYTPAQQYEISKVPPNYSAIYDKLSQLKLLEQSGQTATTYNQNAHYNAPQYIYNYVRKPQINYIPINEYQQQDAPNYKTTQPTNTFVQTYTPTQVDITTTPAQYEQNYAQVGAPGSSYNEQQQQQKAAVQSPTQYIQDVLRQPIIIVNRKPLRVPQEKLKEQRQKVFEEQLKIYEEQQRLYGQRGFDREEKLYIDTQPLQQPIYGQKIIPQRQEHPTFTKPQKIAVLPETQQGTKYESIQQAKYATFHPPTQESAQKEKYDPSYELNFESTEEPRPELVQKMYPTPNVKPVQKYIIVENVGPMRAYRPIPKLEQLQKYHYETVEEPNYDVVQVEDAQKIEPAKPVPKFVIIENIGPAQTYAAQKPEQIQEYATNGKVAPVRNFQNVERYEPVTELQPQYRPPSDEYRSSYLPTEKPNALNQILKNLQESNALPHTFTPENIDNSIRTLVRILNILKKQQRLSNKPIVVAEEVTAGYDSVYENEAGVGLGGSHGDVTQTQVFPADTEEGGTPGKPGVDYPALSSIPQTSFSCKTQRYKGFFGDPDTHCQVWHYCDFNGGQASFLCPNGTVFSQVALTCDWWYNVKCSSTPQLYVLNERLYKYILPFSPKFPEDYSGPLVDRYLALKFQEMEEKMKRERKKSKVAKDGEAKDETPEQDDADELNYENMKNSKEANYESSEKDQYLPDVNSTNVIRSQINVSDPTQMEQSS